MSTISETYDQYVLPTYGRFPIVPERGQGSYLWDAEGNKYLDFCAGIAVCSLGHCHPALTAAIQSQAERLLHCSNLYQIPQQAELAKQIVQHVAIPGKVFFSNSGAEANDGMIKTARRFGHHTPLKNGDARYEIITFQQSFHGRTLGGIAATGQEGIKEGFTPMIPGFHHVDYGDLAATEAAITPHTAAIMLEVIQGEGGIHSATADFLQGLKDLCDTHNLLLMIDEIQTGLGRTGEMMAWRSILPELEPDVVSWAKGLGGGFPIGAFWVNNRILASGAELSSLMGAKSHGSTYGGNPLACAAALSVLQVIEADQLAERAKQHERHIRQEVSSWNSPWIQEIRGMGLMLGFGLSSSTFIEKLSLSSSMTPALYLVLQLTERGLLTVPAGADTVRWLPPLNVTDEEVDKALNIFKDTLDSLEHL